MKNTNVKGVYKEGKKLFTQNLDSCKDIKIYNERLVNYKGKQYRSWNPYRSKLAAAILNGLRLDIKADSDILYLGAATGTTASHISDIVKKGKIFLVENSPIALKKLIGVCRKRENMFPLLEDASHPEKYDSILPGKVDVLYQDISQKNQAEIFAKNVDRYLKEKGTGFMMIKARSIDVSKKPRKIYKRVSSQLKKEGLKIKKEIELSPYEKDHIALVVSK